MVGLGTALAPVEPNSPSVATCTPSCLHSAPARLSLAPAPGASDVKMMQAAGQEDIGFTERGGYSLVHRTVFVYGALMAEECLGALLRGGEVSYRRIAKRSASVAGYRRLAQRDAPAHLLAHNL